MVRFFMKKVSICMSSDNNYAPFVATTMASILDNTKNFCEFYILDGGITKENKDKICELKKLFNNFSIEFIKIDTEKYFKGFITESYITIVSYYRFLLSELFPTLSKILYIDVDIILNSDIFELFNSDLEKYALGAIMDQGDPDYIQKLKNNMEMNQNSTYFNAGVLLINLDLWRKNNIKEKLFETEKKYRGNLKCNDQDVLNKVFEGNYKILDTTFNSVSYSKNTVLRHYYGAIKPWQVYPDICQNDFEEFRRFWHYAQMTPFYQDMLKKCQYKTLMQLRVLSMFKNRKRNTINA